MPEAPVWWVGNRQPSITETILNDDGTAHDLTGQTVRFRMRPLRSNTLKVDLPAVVVSAPAGTVRYDWQAADVDTAGQYLCWWQVTTTLGSATQDVAEAVIEFRDHAAQGTPAAYIEIEQLKASLELTGQSYADRDIELAIGAASRGIDTCTGRRFYLDANANQARTYTATSLRRLEIDDLAAFTSLTIDRLGTGSFTETWAQGTDFILEPTNAPADYRPYERVTIRSLSGRWFPKYIENCVQVTGQFGWQIIPDDIKAATSILAAKLLRRVREAPFGIVTAGIDQGAVMRIARTDPDVYSLISIYSRHPPFV
jgi:hypothetical protein